MTFDVPPTTCQLSMIKVRHIKSHPLRASAKAAIAALRSLKREQPLLDRAPCTDHFCTRCIPTFSIARALVQRLLTQTALLAGGQKLNIGPALGSHL